jgi:hypothetical protein
MIDARRGVGPSILRMQVRDFPFADFVSVIRMRAIDVFKSRPPRP